MGTEVTKSPLQVWTVTVFESGDGKTSVWGVFYTEEDAKDYKKELEDNEDNFSDGYYLEISVEEQEVRGKAPSFLHFKSE